MERRVPGPRGAGVARYTPHDLEAGGAVGGNGSAADLVFVNGAVYTVDATRSWAQAVAVRDGRIALVGTDDDIRAAVGGATEVIDLAGRMLVPGFQDAHVHPVSAGIDMLRCDLHDLDSKAGYLKAIAAYADANPEEPWVLGGGWSMDVFPRGCPAKDALDTIVPDRPVFLPNRDGHSAWVNSVALERAEVSSVTLDPADGRIERDADGSPSGTLHE
ncbi:MAG: amidohydrolase, partial [Actinobacteria bacterium]